MKSYSQKVKLQYKMLARVYDLLDIVVFQKNNPRTGLSKHIPNEDLSILDVCVGTGNSSIAIATKNNKNTVTGIDLSEQMLNVAQNKIKRKRLKNISVKRMDATLIDSTEEFDVVTTSLSLHEMPKEVMQQVVINMWKALKQNGKMYIIEWDRPKKPLSSAIFTLFPYLMEPSGFGDFLKMDWSDFLNENGFKLEAIEGYTFTKLIIAVKN